MAINDFFEALFPALQGSLIEFRFIAGPAAAKSFYFDSVDDAVLAAVEAQTLPSITDAYFGVCPRCERSGAKTSIRVVNALWADVDAKDFDGGKEGALAALHGFTPAPSFIVDSGHGFHAYWVLESPVRIESTDDVERVEGVLKAIATAIGGDKRSAELARILRIPGTKNVKDHTSPLSVTIIESNPDWRSPLSAFPAPSVEAAGKPRNETGWIASTLADLAPGNRNDTFTKIAGRLHQGGWTSAEIMSLLLPHAQQVQFPSAELQTTVDGICSRYPVGNPLRATPTNSGKTEAESRPLVTVTPSELLSRTPDSITWRVEGVLPAQGIGILAAPAGYGKSWAILDLAIATALGEKWLGHFQTLPGRVLYIDEESSEELLGIRIRKLLAFRAGRAETLDIHLCVGQSVSLSDPAGIARLRALLSALRPKLVIVDSFIRVHRAEENSASDMAAVSGVIRELVREFDCTFYFADHQRKAGAGETSLDTMLRGSTEKAAFVDTLFSMKKTSVGLIIEHSKSRFAEPVPTFVMQIEDPVPGSTRVIHAGKAEEIKKAAMVAEARPFIEGVLEQEEWVSRQDLVAKAKEAKIKETAISATLKLMVLDGSAKRDDRPSKSGRGNKAAHFTLLRGGAGQDEEPGGDAEESVFDFPTISSGEPEADSEEPTP